MMGAIVGIKKLLSVYIRLSCYDDFAEQIPESFMPLLPVEPLPTFKFGSNDSSKFTPWVLS